MRDVVRVFLSGDVMLGRGVDQILPVPGDPRLWERYVTDARTYVELTEEVSGPIPRPVDVAWPWGEALAALDDADTDVRVINLETSITREDDHDEGKVVHYRMEPGNVGAVTVVRPDVCALANNHVLDFGVAGLRETLEVLSVAGLATAGAGHDQAEARRPAVVPVGASRRMLVFSVGLVTSGIPPRWAASADRPGVDLLEGPWDTAAAGMADRIRAWKRPGDLVVVSIHWGSNWGYQIVPEQTRLAHALIDGGVDLVHGHSSHHPRSIELHRGRLILYGCGDLLNDYEGISGHEEYRDDLRLLYLADLDAATGGLVDLRIVPMQSHRMRLRHASAVDVSWLQSMLDRTSRNRGVRIVADPDGGLVLERA
jgi:poly-gamma-glutamate capsule biosynthesis protein CapA/YwtB (metallophosphatase superfamily)